MGGASCLRKSVLEKIGGFRQEFFRQAEEYDLSFRIWQAGYTVERREDVVFRHDKETVDEGPSITTSGRNSELVRSMDLRNNLIIAQRFLPENLAPIYWDDWRLRYEALARHFGHRRAAVKALWSARLWAARDSFTGRRLELDEGAMENIFHIRRQAKLVGDWSRRNSVWRVAIADFGKNIWATYNACHSSGLQLRCVVDENAAFSDLKYRGLPILPASQAFYGGGIDGVVVANINPAQVEHREKTISKLFKGPVLKLWEVAASCGTGARPPPEKSSSYCAEKTKTFSKSAVRKLITRVCAIFPKINFVFAYRVITIAIAKGGVVKKKAAVP